MFRKSRIGDIDEVVKIYDNILQNETQSINTGWGKDIYPTRRTAQAAHDDGELFVMELEGKIVATAIINQKQLDEYSGCKWEHHARDDEVMVLHTLAVDPAHSGKGLATGFVAFYESYALENGCMYLRLDTNKINKTARRLYKKLGYIESGIVPCKFNDLGDIQLVCLEKKLERI